MPLFKVNNTFINTKEIQVAGDLHDYDNVPCRFVNCNFYIRFKSSHIVYAHKADCLELIQWLDEKASKGKCKKTLAPKQSKLKAP